MKKKMQRGPGDRAGLRSELDATESGATAMAATETEVDVMGRTSKELGKD